VTARAYLSTVRKQQQLYELKKDSQESPILVREAVTLFCQDRPIAESTKHTHQMKLRQFIAALRPLDVERFLSARRKVLSASTFRLEVAILKTFFRWVDSNFLIPLNPLEKMRLPSRTPSPGRCLSYREEFTLLTSATPYTVPRILLARDAGMRCRDIARLERRNLDFEALTLKFWVSKNARDLLLPMTNRLAQELRGYEPLEGDRFLFLNRKVEPLRNPSCFLKWLRKETSLDFRFHDLRHTFFTRLQEACHDELLARYCLGHHLRVTAGIYYHPSLESIREAFLKMEEITLNALAEYAIHGTSQQESRE
jgi:integrase